MLSEVLSNSTACGLQLRRRQPFTEQSRKLPGEWAAHRACQGDQASSAEEQGAVFVEAFIINGPG
jgi:hypothetical protein